MCEPSTGKLRSAVAVRGAFAPQTAMGSSGGERCRQRPGVLNSEAKAGNQARPFMSGLPHRTR
jgi:hypothetical protein